jgi:hypothetical protein
MKMRDMVRRFSYVTALAVLSFGPGFAQSAVANPVSAPALTRGVSTFVVGTFRDDWNWDKKKKRKVAAAEGGSAALYLLLAGLTCCGALLLRSRQPLAEKSV